MVPCLNVIYMNMIYVIEVNSTEKTKGLHHYRKTSSISRTESQSLNVSCILAQLSSLNPLKPAVELRMKL